MKRFQRVPVKKRCFLRHAPACPPRKAVSLFWMFPTGLLEVTPGFKVDPATLLAALDQYGIIHLALEPTSGLELDVADVITLNLGELYNKMNEYRKK